MTQRILESLTYGCYKTNRELTPHVKPEDWQPCFDAPVGPMEARYQAELGQRMNDLLERMHRSLHEGHDQNGGAPCEGNGCGLLTESPSPFLRQGERDREDEAMNPRVVYGSDDDAW